MLYNSIKKLVQYGLETELITKDEIYYTRNLLLDLFGEEDYEEPEEEYSNVVLEEVLQELLEEALKKGVLKEDTIVHKDLFDTKIMNCLMPRPSQVIEKFWKLYHNSPRQATDYFYKISQDSDYIRRYRIAKDRRWKVYSDYGEIDITINLSKPEKDPKAIAMAKKMKQSGYPKCLLCMENVGYQGRINHPARENHRVIPVEINEMEWGFQYSPYVYYNEHCIVFHGQHVPMKIDRETFVKLFDFVSLFPHYFLGSNADLPIVGGSILTHDHFQGGNYSFAMAEAEIEEYFDVPGYEDVESGIVKWPLSVIRLRSDNKARVIEMADHVLKIWRGYTDEAAFVYAHTDDEPHNTITPIARMNDGKFELDLALRNNITTEEHPLGVYHPHAELHHIKKENIGLIEVMGLAVLPARLKEEMEVLADYLTKSDVSADNEIIQKHLDWVETFRQQYDTITNENVMGILEKEIGNVFVRVLEDAGVYKCTQEGREGFRRFIKSL